MFRLGVVVRAAAATSPSPMARMVRPDQCRPVSRLPVAAGESSRSVVSPGREGSSRAHRTIPVLDVPTRNQAIDPQAASIIRPRVGLLAVGRLRNGSSRLGRIDDAGRVRRLAQTTISIRNPRESNTGAPTGRTKARPVTTRSADHSPAKASSRSSIWQCRRGSWERAALKPVPA